MLKDSDIETLLQILEQRFAENMHRHKGLDWSGIDAKLRANPKKLWSLNQMENSGGEPDVVILDAKTKELIFVDCAKESPGERRSFCYDKEALDKRKANKPKNSAIESAKEIGVELISREEYIALQKLESFDTKTSSWLNTPENIRKLGGAIFGDFRFNTVFIYHNGAESYYGGRGFRTILKF